MPEEVVKGLRDRRHALGHHGVDQIRYGAGKRVAFGNLDEVRLAKDVGFRVGVLGDRFLQFDGIGERGQGTISDFDAFIGTSSCTTEFGAKGLG
jgi:hypothetical protein